MGSLHTIDTADARARAGGSRPSAFASDLDLPSWEEFTDARERFFANLASAPPPPPAPRGRAEDTVVTAG